MGEMIKDLEALPTMFDTRHVYLVSSSCKETLIESCPIISGSSSLNHAYFSGCLFAVLQSSRSSLFIIALSFCSRIIPLTTVTTGCSDEKNEKKTYLEAAKQYFL